MIKKAEKFYICYSCGTKFLSGDGSKVCSNCFACTGCEIYKCPGCAEEVVIKAIKRPNFNHPDN